jgi:RNA polymerase sigma-70 factor (ECF subfamily)
MLDVGKLAAVQARKHVLMMADTELIQRCQQGDHAAFKELVKRSERRIFGLIYQIVRSANDVEDIAQEVFTKLFFSLPQFRLNASFDAWLYRITVNQSYDYLRKRKRNQQVTEADLSEEEAAFFESDRSVTSPKYADVSKRMEIKQVAENLLSALPPKERSLLILKEIEEFSIEELMGIFKASRSAIKLRLFRARKHLKAVYEKSKKGK